MLFFATMILSKRSQPENALSPTSVTLSGIVIEVRRWQPENASSPIVFTPLEMVTELNLEQ